ncbi:MAG: transcription elongation factor GreA [Lachnospiraceae bacterium]|nr:transcription elongation factor GreA [Lachnospiraceae bacterium]
MAKNRLTREGLKKYEDELNYLKLTRMDEISQKIKEAREQGDLSENADYDAARDEQRDVQARIDEIEEILKDVEVVDVEQKRGKPSVVSFGCSVKIKNVSTGKEKSITLKSSSEAQSLAGVISDESPLGRALAGAKKGSVVSFDAPAGVQEFEVVDIWVEKDR